MPRCDLCKTRLPLLNMLRKLRRRPKRLRVRFVTLTGRDEERLAYWLCGPCSGWRVDEAETRPAAATGPAAAHATGAAVRVPPAA